MSEEKSSWGSIRQTGMRWLPPPAGELQSRLFASLAELESFWARAIFLGEHIDLRRYSRRNRLGVYPLLISIEHDSAAVLFRYGVIVLFNASPESEDALLQEIAPLVKNPYADPETEQVALRFRPDAEEGIEDEAVCLRSLSVGRIQLVATVLSKSVVLAEYESHVTRTFDQVEPFSQELREYGRTGRKFRNMLRQIGNVLLAEHRIVGRVEVRDKPELLWEHPELETLYQRLEDEFEIAERYIVLERKLALISRTVSTVLELLNNLRTLRVEWYIVILIVLEILLTLYELFWHAPH